MGILNHGPFEIQRRQAVSEIRSRAQNFLRVCDEEMNWQTCAATGYGGCCSSNQGGCDASCTNSICTKNQKWYTCDDIGYAGCCVKNPCSSGGCPDNNSNVCANLGNNVKWYDCKDGSFTGCCNEDPCGEGKCPDAGKSRPTPSPSKNQSTSTPSSTVIPDKEEDFKSSPSSESLSVTTVTLSQLLTSTAPGDSVPQSSVTHTAGPTVTNTNSNKKKTNLAAPIGAGIGGVVFLAILIGAFFLLRRKRRNSRHSYTGSQVSLRGGAISGPGPDPLSPGQMHSPQTPTGTAPASPAHGLFKAKSHNSRHISQVPPPAYNDNGPIAIIQISPEELPADPALMMAELPAQSLVEMPADNQYDQPMQEINRGSGGSGFLVGSGASIGNNQNTDFRDRKPPEGLGGESN